MRKAVLSAFAMSSALTATAGLSAGFARVGINPPMGSNIPGYFEDRRVDGVLDDTEANAVAFSDGTNSAVLVSFDLVEIKGLSTAWRRRAAAATGLPPEAFYFACTHTHTGGNVGRAADSYEIGFDSDPEYDKAMEGKVVEVCRAALADMKPAQLLTGRASYPGAAFIRRYRMKDGSVTTNPGVGNPNVVAPVGQPDDEVQVVRLVRTGSPEILLVNFQTHPDVIGGTRISADWPGFTRRTLEMALGDGTKCIFFNGAQGDSNHVNVRPEPGRETNRRYEHARQMGRMVAGAVLGVYGFCVPTPAGRVRCAVKYVPMPIRKRSAEDLPAARADWALYCAGNAKEIKGRRFRLVEAARIVRLEKEPDEIPFPVSAVAVGDALCFTGLPCEPFTELGRAVKRASPFRMTFYTCLTNGSYGYLPTAEGCGGESYESTSTIFDPAAAGRAVQAQIDVLRAL